VTPVFHLTRDEVEIDEFFECVAAGLHGAFFHIPAF